MRARARIRLVVAASCVAATFAVAAPAGAEWPLRGYWPLFEGRGQTIHDISGHGNEGRLGKTGGADSRDAEWVRGSLGSERRCGSTATTTSWSRRPPRCGRSA